MASSDSSERPVSVRRVFARVHLQSSVHAELRDTEARGLDPGRRLVMLSGNQENLSLHVSLSAEDTSGRRTQTAGRDFGTSGPRRGIWHRWHGGPLPTDPEEEKRIVLREHRVDLHDIEDAINLMLGRDPLLHRPPRLAWDNLIKALATAGVIASEQDLIDAPLTIELDPEVQAELDHG
jgi:hypothetical protein